MFIRCTLKLHLRTMSRVVFCTMRVVGGQWAYCIYCDLVVTGVGVQGSVGTLLPPPSGVTSRWG